MYNFRIHMLWLANIAAKFRGFMGTNVSDIVHALNDKKWETRLGGWAALSKFSEEGMKHILRRMVSDECYS
jgi:hypothetical protein